MDCRVTAASDLTWPRRADFLRVQERRLGEIEAGTPEAKALATMTWDEVRVDLNSTGSEVSTEYAANIVGVSRNEFMDVAQAIGLPYASRLERKDVRKVLMALIVRTPNADVMRKERLKEGVHTFADSEPPED